MDNVVDRAANAATGAVVEAADAVSEPSASVRHVERRGAAVNRRLVQTAREVLDGTIPQRVATTGLRVVKTRARRRDLVGDAAYRWLELVHTGVGSAARTLGRLEQAVEPPARPATAGRVTPRAAATTKTTTSTTVRRTAKPSRPATRAASKPAPKSA